VGVGGFLGLMGFRAIGLILVVLCWLIGLGSLGFGADEGVVPFMKRNRVGYHPDMPKLFWLEGLTPSAYEPLKLLVRQVDRKNELFWPEGKFANKPYAEFRGGGLILADASALSREGSMTLYPYGGVWKPQMGSVGFDFYVGRDVFYGLLGTAVRSFYYNRAGQLLLDAQTGLSQEAGHTAVYGLQGGWYEGGTYNQHTVATALTAGHLMKLYEVLPGRDKALNLNYPSLEQKGELVPDVLHEAKVGLKWLLKQQQADGAFLTGVYHAVDLGLMVKPAQAVAPRVVLPASQWATATAVAVLAQAAQVYREVDASFAISCLLAAQKGSVALASVKGLPAFPLPVNFLSPEPPAVQEVPAVWHSDYWRSVPQVQWREAIAPYLAWASYRLLVATGQETGLGKALTSPFLGSKPLLPQWRQVPLLAMTLMVEALPDEQRALLLSSSEQLLKSTLLLENPYLSPYGRSREGSVAGVPVDNFEWVQAGILLGEAGLLAEKQLSMNRSIYLGASYAIFNYLMGFNMWNQLFITGDAEATGLPLVQRPCHQVARSQKRILPGFLVRGFNTEQTGEGIPFQDSSRQCGLTTSDLVAQAQYAYWLGLMHRVHNPTSLAVVREKEQKAKKSFKVYLVNPLAKPKPKAVD
jgi:endoglucanase